MNAGTKAAPADQEQRDRFREEWRANFAVSANAGSGKTTAISERLAAIALGADGAELLGKTAVVTFTRKAAAQIGQRARAVLVRRLAAERPGDLTPLDQLERAFFGTIHSFCLLLAQRHGQTLGLNLNPSVVETAEMEEVLWEEFLEQDPMQFTALPSVQVEAFLRHAPLESIFVLARQLDRSTAGRLIERRPLGGPPPPSGSALAAILGAASRGKGAEALRRNQEQAQRWLARFRDERGYLPLPKPEGSAAGIEELFAAFLAPVKSWLADAGAVLAAELALRFRGWRFDRGVQTYADQVESALAVLEDAATLDRVRAEGWRIVLDEAQDTDPQQFAVLVEVARPPGAAIGSWPDGNGPGPRAGHFCLVGDAQQSIYGSRADVRNFSRHLAAFARKDGGELLKFSVTFRTPRRVVDVLNMTLAPAFGPGRGHNCGLPAAAEMPAPCLQVAYEPLVAAAGCAVGGVGVIAVAPTEPRTKVEARLASEVRQLAIWLKERGPAGVGARHWDEICLIAPRNDWLLTARKELERAGLQAALQVRRSRSGDHPVYAWLAGLLATIVDPENVFEVVGVLREVFAISDGLLAAELRKGPLQWEEPQQHPEPLRGALQLLWTFIQRIDADGEPLGRFAHDLVTATELRGKAAAIDPHGMHLVELDRLLARATELGLAGGGPREWRAELLAGLETGRPEGQERPDAVNLMTSHSAKGLEWPVVIPIGMWRAIGKFPEEGMRLVAIEGQGAKVYFDRLSLPEAVRESRERERQRELVRLLYVTLTRARRALVLPVGEEVEKGSFFDLWGGDLKVGADAGTIEWDPPPAPRPVAAPKTCISAGLPAAAMDFPRRLLPHELGRTGDQVRSRLHENAEDAPAARSSTDPLEYGTWWHETLEFLPWESDEAGVQAHLADRVAAAESRGFGERAAKELGRLKESEAWKTLRDRRWRVLTEVSVVAPIAREGGWVDGIIDLLAHDEGTGELLIVDWKTNRAAPGEGPEEILGRLQAEYAEQLGAYRECVAGFFPEARPQVAVFSTEAGVWRLW